MNINHPAYDYTSNKVVRAFRGQVKAIERLDIDTYRALSLQIQGWMSAAILICLARGEDPSELENDRRRYLSNDLEYLRDMKRIKLGLYPIVLPRTEQEQE